MLCLENRRVNRCVDDFVHFMNILNRSGFLYVTVQKTQTNDGLFCEFYLEYHKYVNINSRRITVASIYIQ